MSMTNPIKQWLIYPTLSLLLFILFTVLFLGPLQDWSYYPGFSSNLMLDKLLISLIGVYLVAIVVPWGDSSPSGIFFCLIFLLYVIPRFVTYACHGFDGCYPVLVALAFVTAIFLRSCLSRRSIKKGFRLRDVRIREIRAISHFARGCFFAGAAFLVLCYFLYLGVPTVAAFNFENIYEIRAESSLPGMISSISTLYGTFLLPLEIAYALARGRTRSAVALSLLELLAFLWTGNKAWLFIIALLWFVNYMWGRGLLSIGALAGVLLLVLILFSVVLVALDIDLSVITWSFSLFIRRLIFVPSVLSFSYFDFFLFNPPVLLQNTVLSFLTPMPSAYDIVPYVRQVGQAVLGTEGAWANCGLFGGELAQLGPWSFVIIILNLVVISRRLGQRRMHGNAGKYTYLCAILFAFLLLNISSVRLLWSPSGLLFSMLYIFQMREIDLDSSSALQADLRRHGLMSRESIDMRAS